MIKLISREKFEYIARKVLHYPLHDAEKDYFLTLAMKLVSESPLSNTLVFKGGTSIYHCYLEQLRFSEDLDFTSLDKNIEIDEIKGLFNKSKVFEVKKEYTSNATIKIEKLKYYGILDVPNSIKFEVDRLQNVALPMVKKKYFNVWDLNFYVNVMDPIEVCAEKLRACNDRFRYRDFYDLYMMVNILKIDIKNAVKLIPKKEIRKDFSKVNITNNLNLAVNEVSTIGDTVMYEKAVTPRRLKDFFNKIDLPSFSLNVLKRNLELGKNE